MEMRYLQKAVTLTSPDFDKTTPGQGGLLSPQQTTAFLRMAIDESILLQECRVETNINPKFEVPRISLNSRVLKRGSQATRVDSNSRVKPASGLMELSTVLLKGEVLISDESLEDTIERGALADTIMEQVSQAVGRDVEEISIKSDTARDPGGADTIDDDVLDLLDGAIKSATTNLPSAQLYDAAGVTTAEEVFAAMVRKLPARYRRNAANLRFYTPVLVKDIYNEQLSARGTILGDQMLVANGVNGQLAFRGTPVKSIPIMTGTSTVNGAAINYDKYVFLCDPSNFVAGFQRKVRMEKFRDPREGATSFLPTVRFDCDWANPEAFVMAKNVDLS